MLYDPQGNGAAADDALVRRGKARESLSRLEKQASAAEAAGFGYGVSVTSPPANQTLARDPADTAEAARQDFEDAGFEVRYTPTNRDSDHHTIVFPKPLTPEMVDKFKDLLGRS